MYSQETSLRLPNSHLLFQDSAAAHLRLPSAPPLRRPAADPHPKTRPLTTFFDDKLFSHHRDRYFSADQAAEFRRTLYCGDAPDSNWNGGSDDEEEEDDDEDDGDDEVDEGDGEVDGLVGVEDADKSNNGANTINNNHSSNHDNNSSGSVHSGADKIGNGKSKPHSSFASNREVMVKDGENHRRQQQQQGRIGNFQNAVTIVEPDGDMYYSQYLQGPEGSGAAGQKDLVVENGCGFSGRKDCSFSSESGESLRAILSDPVTGALMDDAMILPCGHSFGSGGIQHVISMKTCYTCSLSISEDSIAPNLSLQAAVQAFCREEELQFYRSTKRRKERYDQEKGNNGDSAIMDPPRGRGVQFPFAVTDRVIIKGNKRTPQRFVGREAVVTTQCLNGWYVVKTLDNAESVKLQYRSLAKVSDDPSSKSMSCKIAPSWL